MACNFDISDVFVSPETRNVLAQSPKIWKVLFLPEKCNSESSPGHLECLPDEPGVFLQINVSSEKPWKNIKLYLHPENFFGKSFTGHVDFSFDTLVESICQGLEFLHSKSTNRVKTLFLEETFCLKVFFWTHGILFWQICKNCFAKKPQLFPLCPKGKKVWFVTTFSARNVLLHT